ncbi:MAG: protein kinase domain-containing protein [Candidatus Xenobia bacterium]
MATGPFLELAVPMAAALERVHAMGTWHGDVRPRRFATRPDRTDITLLPPAVDANDLPYMAPEQTGRMNRRPDPRSDLYSLGIIFYEMLAGRRPFEASTPLEWVHCHVAQSPPPLSAVVPDIPAALRRGL